MRKSPILFVLLALFPLAGMLTGQTAGSNARAKAASAASAAAVLVDINTASKATLMTLKGIGPAYADQIIQGRPYARKDQLLIRRVLPKRVYDSIKTRITAKR